MRFLILLFMILSFSAYAKTVVVQSGDTLYSLARKHQVSVTTLAKHNRISPPYALKVGQSLSIPLSGKVADLVAVKPGETLYAISKRTGVSVENLAKWNNLSAPYALRAGQMLHTRSPASIASKPLPKPMPVPIRVLSQPSGGTYIVQPGDTLYSIATRNHLSVGDLKKYNGLLDAGVQVGQVLQLLSPIASSSVVEKESLENRTSILSSLANIFLAEKDVAFISPLQGRVISPFGLKPSGLKNNGINIGGKAGQPVVAAEDGAVVYVGNSLKGLGNAIIIKHPQDYMTVYAHMGTILTGVGEVVKKGEKVGTVGRTGKVKSPQLHFEIRHKMSPKNPEKLFVR